MYILMKIDLERFSRKKTSIAISVIGHVIMGFKLKILGLCISEVRLGRPPIKMESMALQLA